VARRVGGCIVVVETVGWLSGYLGVMWGKSPSASFGLPSVEKCARLFPARSDVGEYPDVQRSSSR
jgi:hypothetical protein